MAERKDRSRCRESDRNTESRKKRNSRHSSNCRCTVERQGRTHLSDGSSRSRSRGSVSLSGSLDSDDGRGSSDNGGGGNGGSLDSSNRSSGTLVGRAVAGDVASLGTLVADLTGGAEGTTVRSGAVTRDVAELAAGVALHGLSLAITGEVVGTTALVAGCGAGVAAESTAESTLETTASTTGTAASGGTGRGSTGSGSSGVGAVASKVARLAAVVAAAVGTTVQAQGGAVSLDVAETLAVVALLGLGGTGQRAGARLVAGLLAVVAETLSGRADLSIVANSATLVACATRQHHSGGIPHSNSSQILVKVLSQQLQ